MFKKYGHNGPAYEQNWERAGFWNKFLADFILKYSGISINDWYNFGKDPLDMNINCQEWALRYIQRTLKVTVTNMGWDGYKLIFIPKSRKDIFDWCITNLNGLPIKLRKQTMTLYENTRYDKDIDDFINLYKSESK
jgi:hypothetical protein